MGSGAQTPASSAALMREARRRVRRYGILSSAAGALVVFIAIGFFIPIFIDPRAQTRLGLINGPVVAAYLVVAVALINRRFNSYFREAVGWIAQGRAPDDHEHRATLCLALKEVKMEAAAWTVAGVLFAAINAAVYSWGFAAVSAATIWLGGETTCALTYLLYERALRPLTACALASRPSQAPVAPGVRLRLAMAWSLGTGVPLVGVLVVGVVGVTNPGLHPTYIAAAALFLGVVAWSAGLLAILFSARAIADPLLGVRRGLEQIERGNLAVRVEVDDGSEVGLLQAGFNRMAEGLRERERIRDLFGRQVGEEVAHAALREGVSLGGEEREVGVLFIDLVGSTSLALSISPTELVSVLNRFFCVVIEVVEEHGGLVNKFEGDAALCVFGAPIACEDCAGQALCAARMLARRLARELPDLDFGVGASAGMAVAGNVGSEQRFEYTVIGDPINEAARLAELAKQRPDRVLASDAALQRASGPEAEAWDVNDAALLRGRNEPTQLACPRV